jgi:hypothetical protein
MINFNGARVLSYDHNHLFFGENFRYATRKNISIEGSIYALGNTSGVAPVWSGIDGFVGSAQDYSNIIINGVDFGKGRIENITFAESVDVTRKDYRVSVVTYESGNLFNMKGTYYDGLDFENPNFPAYLLESFNEDFSWTRDENKNEVKTQNVSLKFISGAANGGSGNPIAMAKSFASGLFFHPRAFRLFGGNSANAFAEAPFRYFTENYNQITNECSFSATHKVINDAKLYAFTYTNSVNTDQDGITSVEENGRIAGIADDLWTNAKNGYDIEYPGAYGRCVSTFNYYAPADSYPLSTSKLSLSRQDNKFEGTIEYNVSYNNDPRNKGLYSWEYTQEISRKGDCTFEVGEKGRIKGFSNDCSQEGKYENGLAGWVIIKGGVGARVTDFYEESSGQTKPLKMISKSETKSAFEGTVDYDVKYTDDPSQNVNGFKKVDLTVEDNYSVHKVARYNILGVKEVIQPQGISTEGSRAVSVKIQGYKVTPIETYLAFAKTFANQSKPGGSNNFIDNCKYNWSPSDANFSLDVSWVVFTNQDFSSTTV